MPAEATAISTGTLAALAGFDLMTVDRLHALLAHHEPDEAFAVAAGRAAPAPAVAAMMRPPIVAAWRASATRRDPETWAGACRALGIVALTARHDAFPGPLRVDPQPPAVLFVRGDLEALDARRAGVVGTRNATQSGRDTAFALGCALAEAGVTVVSGLAKGIDGAAHRGVLAAAGARPAAVVGNGPDRPYPRVHTELWKEVCDRGVLLSEWPPGTPPEPFRFPMRNRILAALSEVLAVPGSPRNRAAAGTNHLLRDGAAPVTGVDDVLVALGLDTRRAGPAPFDPRPLPRGVEADVLAACREDPRTLDDVVSALALPMADAAMALARLERAGWVRESGGWFEPVVSWSGR
jgi:DNA processing protein